MRVIDLPFDFFKRPLFDYFKIAQKTILRDIMNEDQNPAS